MPLITYSSSMPVQPIFSPNVSPSQYRKHFQQLIVLFLLYLSSILVTTTCIHSSFELSSVTVVYRQFLLSSSLEWAWSRLALFCYLSKYRYEHMFVRRIKGEVEWLFWSRTGLWEIPSTQLALQKMLSSLQTHFVGFSYPWRIGWVVSLPVGTNRYGISSASRTQGLYW